MINKHRIIKNIPSIALTGLIGVSIGIGIGIAPTFADSPTADKVLYSNNFEKLPDGEPEGDIVVLVKGVLIKAVDGNRVLEFPAEPAEGYGVIFGPEGQNLLAVSARFMATSKGRRSPEFGLGLADTGGYKIMAMPAANELQLLKGEDVKATIPYTWKSGSWTFLKLQARQVADGKFVIEGKAWEKEEPREWMIKFEEQEEPAKGRASAWGSPYASTPIQVDDIAVAASSLSK